MTLEQFQATDPLHRDEITRKAWEAAQAAIIDELCSLPINDADDFSIWNWAVKKSRQMNNAERG